jgi:hypothetical protein
MAKEDNTNGGLLTGAALVLGWLVPGAGHALLGYWLRGLVIFAAIGGTFWAGVAMGGVLTVDYRNERAWFIAQMLTGAQGLVSWKLSEAQYNEVLQDKDVRQRFEGLLKAARIDRANLEAQVVDEALAKRNLAMRPPTDTLARAYSGIAGLLNVMCVFDAVMLSLIRSRRREEPQP